MISLNGLKSRNDTFCSFDLARNGMSMTVTLKNAHASRRGSVHLRRVVKVVEEAGHSEIGV